MQKQLVEFPHSNGKAKLKIKHMTFVHFHFFLDRILTNWLNIKGSVPNFVIKSLFSFY